MSKEKDGQEIYEILAEYMLSAPAEIKSAWETFDSFNNMILSQAHKLMDRVAELEKERDALKTRIESAPRVWLYFTAQGLLFDAALNPGSNSVDDDCIEKVVHAVPVEEETK